MPYQNPNPSYWSSPSLVVSRAGQKSPARRTLLKITTILHFRAEVAKFFLMIPLMFFVQNLARKCRVVVHLALSHRKLKSAGWSIKKDIFFSKKSLKSDYFLPKMRFLGQECQFLAIFAQKLLIVKDHFAILQILPPLSVDVRNSGVFGHEEHEYEGIFQFWP